MIFEYGHPLRDLSVVDRFERKLGHGLPKSYKSMVLENDGAHIFPSGVFAHNPETDRQEWICCDALVPFEADDSFSMETVNFDDTYRPGSGLVVFGIEAGGYMFAFDYRTSKEPKIVLFANDLTVEPGFVADNFDDFVASMVEPPANNP
jgi:hypothetical protein